MSLSAALVNRTVIDAALYLEWVQRNNQYFTMTESRIFGAFCPRIMVDEIIDRENNATCNATR